MTPLTAIGAVTNLAKIPGEAITPLATRRIIPGDKMMMVHWEMKQGADSAAHHHPHEQLVYVISGKLKLRVGDEWHVLGAGGVVMIPGGVVHQADVLEDTEVVDIFSPPREDFLGGGTPAYFVDVDKKKS